MRTVLTIFLGMVLAATAVFLFMVVRAQPAADYPFYDLAGEGPLVIAHQGGELLRPSNTLPAFEHAVELGVDVLEMDVHATADGAIVVMHDDTVDRTTDGTGAIKEMSLDEIKALDAGDYWTADDGVTFPYRGQGITVPTLDEIFAAFPDMPMNIEIKQAEPSMVGIFCDKLREYAMTDQVLVASFHDSVMQEFRETCPEVATSMTETEIRPFFVLNTIYLGATYQPPGTAFQVPEYSGDLHVATERFVRGAHAQNVDVHVWTVNDASDMERMLALGVDGIITDRPDLLLQLLGRME